MNYIKELISRILSKTKVEMPWYNLYGDNIAPSINYPVSSMYDLIKESTCKYPRYIAYTYFGKKCKYRKFKREIDICAKALKQLGVKEKDRITICMPNTPTAIIMFYAINKVGAISNMIHPLSSEKEIEFYLNKSQSKYILCLDLMYFKIKNIINSTKLNYVIVSSVSDNMNLLLKLIYKIKNKSKIEYGTKIIKWSKFYSLNKQYKKDIVTKMQATDDAVILYSGGTTGEPKGVVLSNLNFNALGIQSFKMTDPAKATDSALVIMPIFHGFGLGVSIHTCLISGMNCILIPKFNSRDFSKLIKKYKPNFLIGVPTMYEALINSVETKKDYLKSITTVICGGDVLNQTLRNKVDAYLEKYGSKAKIRVGYGLTECTAASCLTPRYYYKEGGIGIPFPDMLYKIVKFNSLIKAKTNEVGEICISGPTVMKRYLDDIEETSKVLKRHSDGKIWLHTGDAGYMDSQGLIFFKSRLKRMIISSGYNIYPQYIEKNLLMHPAVLNCAVIGIDHPYKKQVPKAYIVLRDNFDLTDDLKEDIRNHCIKTIAKYALPYEYEYVKEIPKTLIGKVAFKQLQ